MYLKFCLGLSCGLFFVRNGSSFDIANFKSVAAMGDMHPLKRCDVLQQFNALALIDVAPFPYCTFS